MDNNTKLLNRIGIQVGLQKCHSFGCIKVATYLVFFKVVKTRPPWAGSNADKLPYCSECTNIFKRHPKSPSLPIERIEKIKDSPARIDFKGLY